jgi:hypothetical protein
VFPARRSGPQLQVHAPARAVAAHPLAERLQTGPAPLHMPIFTVWRPGLVPIQTGAPAQIRAADRPSDTPAVLRGRCVASVDHTGLSGLLRRPARCSDHTARAHAATAVPSDCLRFCMCGLVLCGSSAGQSRRKNGLCHPGREPRGCLHARGEKSGHLAAPAGRQTKWGECREGPLASGVGSFSSVTGEPRRRLELGAQDFIA